MFRFPLITPSMNFSFYLLLHINEDIPTLFAHFFKVRTKLLIKAEFKCSHSYIIKLFHFFFLDCLQN